MGDVVVASRERTEPYGSWPSPVTPEVVAAGGKSFHDVHVVGRTVSWIEQRPDEGGRGVIVACEPGGDAVEVTPAPWSARSRVYAYGGGAFTTDGRRYLGKLTAKTDI